MAATVVIGNRLPTTEGHGEQVHDLAGQPGEATSQHVTHHGRYAGDLGPVQGNALRREQPRDLLGEKRVARGAVVHGLDQRCRRVLSAHLLDQLADHRPPPAR